MGSGAFVGKSLDKNYYALGHTEVEGPCLEAFLGRGLACQFPPSLISPSSNTQGLYE